MSTHWRVLDLNGWAFDGPQVTLAYEADDEDTVAIIEQAAEDAGVLLERIESEEPKPLPEDYWETAE